MKTYRHKILGILALLLLLTSGCGKNDGFYSPSGFNPQLPQGYPPAYTPFLPIDYYMRNNPTYAPYWPQFWGQWNGYCNQNGYSPYDFSLFWNSYFPQNWSQGSAVHISIYMNQNYGGWGY